MKEQRFRMVMGRNCIEELLEYAPERIVKIFTAVSNDPKDIKVKKMLEKAKKEKIEVETTPKNILNQWVNSESHQMFVATVKERHALSLKEFFKKMEEKEESIVVMLDSVFDPQNVGALLRVSECFGVDAVLFSKNRGGDITPVVSKASAGASEWVEIIKVSNLAETVTAFQEEGYEVMVADVDVGSKNIYEVVFPKKLVIVMGSEGEGIQPLIKKRADIKAYIPMMGRITSLNVSQAASVFLALAKRI